MLLLLLFFLFKTGMFAFLDSYQWKETYGRVGVRIGGGWWGGEGLTGNIACEPDSHDPAFAYQNQITTWHINCIQIWFLYCIQTSKYDIRAHIYQASAGKFEE